MKLPTKEEWFSFLNFKKQTTIDTIVHSDDYEEALQQGLEYLEKSTEYVNASIELSEKFNKDINKWETVINRG